LSERQIEYRELKWSDFPSFQKLMLQAPGAFERATGMDQLSDYLWKYLHRRRLWTLLSLMRALGRAPFRFFVGVDQGQIVGSSGLAPLPKAGYIFAVVTDQAARNRGIASHILEQIHRSTHKTGKPWVALDVETDNEIALRLYRKLGYEERAQFNWHVGPTPSAMAHSSDAASEVPRSKMKEVAAWVNLHQLPALRDPLPATAKMFSHLENMTSLPNTRKKTWCLSSSGQTIAVVRGFYIPMIKTGFLIPAGYDSAISGDSILSLVEPAVNWVRSLGATRTEVVIPEPPGAWESAMISLGLPKAVSTMLMVRPSTQ
jgi:ribosomal protein S18 acetylase RimI-like enzyme